MPEPTILDVPGDFRSNACYAGACHVYDFSNKNIIPVVESTFALTKKDRDKAIVGTYFLIHDCLEAVTLMNHLSVAQAVGAVAKTLFELALELRFLCNDKSDASAGRYFAYAKIEKHNMAKKLLKFYSEKKLEPEAPDCETLESTIKPDAYIQGLIAAHWPGKKVKDIKHWSGTNEVRKRAEHLGGIYERLYWETYPIMNWYAHPNPVSWVRSTLSHEHSGIQTAFISVIKIMTVIFVTMKEEFGFDKVVQDFTQRLLKLLVGPGEVMIGELERMKTEGKFSADVESAPKNPLNS